MIKNQLIFASNAMQRPYNSFMNIQKDALLEKTVTFIAIVYPFTTIPQLMNIWVDKNVAGVSVLTWSLYLILTIPLLLYSVRIKEKRLTLMWSLWLVIYLLIISGVILYG